MQKRVLSARQVEANRLNSYYSTGPKTPEGKSHSRLNAQKHGLYTNPAYYIGADREAYAEFMDEIRALTKPEDDDEIRLTEEWGLIQWRLQCVRSLEKDWWEAYERASDAGNPMGSDSVFNQDPFERLRLIHQAITHLERLMRQEGRLKRAEAKLLPLVEPLVMRSLDNGHTVALDRGYSMPTESAISRGSYTTTYEVAHGSKTPDADDQPNGKSGLHHLRFEDL